MAGVNFYRKVMNIVQVFFICFDLVSQTQAYSSGAPSGTCMSMFPNHRSPPTMTTPPYNIKLSSKTYSSSQQISVTIESDASHFFKGFLITARPVGGNVSFGRFNPITGTRGLQCSNKADSTITHSDPSLKDKVTLIWEAPNSNVGDLQMIATIVKEKSIFWLNVTSEILQPTVGFTASLETTSVTPISTSSASTTSQTPQGVNEIQCQSQENCKINWKVDQKTGISFFTFSLESFTKAKYISLALSRDQKMGDDSVMECLRYPNGSIIAQLSYNDGYKNTIVASDSLKLVSKSFVDGWMSCSFTRNNSLDNSKVFNISESPWYLLVAIGNTNPNKANQKDHHTTKFSTETRIDLLKDEGIYKINDLKKILINAHGSVMVFAWLFFASVGMFIARYCKILNKQINGAALWFQLHRSSMFFTFLLTLIGFIIIFIAADGYSQSAGLPYDAHPVLGIIVMIFTLLNPIMAFFRPGKESSNRILFNWAHRSLGVTSFIFADATIFIGILWHKGSSHAATPCIAVMSFFIVYKVFAILTIELLQYWKEGNTESFELKAPGAEIVEDKNNSDFIKKILLLCHFMITAVLTILLVIFLNIEDDHEDHHH